MEELLEGFHGVGRPMIIPCIKSGPYNEIKKQVAQNSIGKFVDSIIKPKQNLMDKKNEIKLKTDINFQNKMLEFAKKQI